MREKTRDVAQVFLHRVEIVISYTDILTRKVVLWCFLFGPFFQQIRLQRNALEWSGSYKFWSCADVDIVNAVENQQKLCENGEFDDSIGT